MFENLPNYDKWKTESGYNGCRCSCDDGYIWMCDMENPVSEFRELCKCGCHLSHKELEAIQYISDENY